MEGEAAEDLALSGWENRQILIGQERELTSDRGPVTQRHGTHTAQTPRGTRRACTQATGPLPGADAKSLPGAPSPPRPKQSRTDGNTAARPAHLLAGAVCMALGSADFRKPEGEMTHVVDSGEGRA